MEEQKHQIMETGRGIIEKGLTWGTSGNISVRKDDRIWITASGTEMGELKEEDILVCDMNGKVLEGDKKPSKETGMHLNIYRTRRDVGAVVHSSPFYSTMCACADLPLKANLFIESMYYNSDLQWVPYYHAGSPELAEAVKQASEKANVIFMGNHGLLTYDKNLKEALFAMEITEQMCKMNVYSRMGGFPLKEVDPETVKNFLNGGYYKKRESHTS